MHDDTTTDDAVPRGESESKTVTDAYGNEHVLHINTETQGTHHKHSAEYSEHCPYCNESKDYGMGIDLSDDDREVMTDGGEPIDDGSTLSRETYRDAIETMADVVEEHSEEYDMPIPDMVHEEVDSSEYIIYNDYHLDVLQCSDSEPESECWNLKADSTTEASDLLQMMAYDVMKQDLYSELSERGVY